MGFRDTLGRGHRYAAACRCPDVSLGMDVDGAGFREALFSLGENLSFRLFLGGRLRCAR